MSTSRRKDFKSIFTISVITMGSRILGLVREIVRASILGTSFYSDAFTLAFSIPNLFRRLTAEGIMINAFIPTFCHLKQKEGDDNALAFARNFFWLSTCFLIAFSLVFIAAAPWLVKYLFAAGFTGEPLELTIFLTQFMFAYIGLVSLAAICQGILNSFSTFWVSAFTPLLLNISIIGFAVCLAPHMENPTYGFAIGVLFGGVLQLLFQLPYTFKHRFKLIGPVCFNDPNIRQVGKLMLPTIFGVGIYQINIIISNLIATTLEEGSLASLNFSNRLLELVLGVFVISLTTVILPKLAHLFIDKNYQEISSRLRESIHLIAFITLPVMAGSMIIAEEAISVLFLRGRFDETSLIMTAGALRFHMIGLIFIAWNRVLLTCYQAAKYLKRVVQISFVVMVVNLAGALLFSGYMGHLGIALASSVSQVIQTILLIFCIKDISIQKIPNAFFSLSLYKNVLAAFIMMAGLFACKQYLLPLQLPQILNLFLLASLGGIFFITAGFLFRSEELTQLSKLIRRKIKQ